MSINYRKDDVAWPKHGADFFWFTVMYIGLPIMTIFEWIHWELYGKGPRKSKQ